MKPDRLRDWLSQTHSVRFELVRHFFLRFFDSEFVSTPGQWRAVAGGLFAVLLSSSIFIIPGYFHKYRVLAEIDDPLPFRNAALADVLFLNVAAMLMMGLLTTLQWTSLFPTLRDYLALAGLPIRPRDLFLAKYVALLLLALIFMLVVPLNTSVALPWVQMTRYSPPAIPQVVANFVSTSLASLFVFLALIAVQGVLLNVIPIRHFQRVSLALQAGMLVIILCLAPAALSIPNLHREMTLRPEWAFWAPPLWFSGLHEVIAGNREPFMLKLAGFGLLGIAGAAAASVGTYLWSFRRHRVRVLESTSTEATNSSFAPRIAARLLADPIRLAMCSFIWKTLARSRQHRLILSAYTAIALALIVEAFLGIAISGKWTDMTKAAVSIPLTLSLFVLAGYRYLFRLPVELRANWVFRLNERAGRASFLAGVDTFVAWFGIVPLTAATLAVEWALIGPVRGLGVTLLCLPPALLLREVLFFRLDQVPFTSAYLPGKRPVIETLLIYGLAVGMYVSVLGSFIVWALGAPIVAAGYFLIVSAIFARVRIARREHWSWSALTFEEVLEPAVQTLGIDRD